MADLLVINGPNLNLLGAREPEHYGRDTLDTINERLRRQAEAAGHGVQFFPSAAEHVFVARVRPANKTKLAFLLLTPAAYTHPRAALRDALAPSHIPFIE